jgi:hypothetical protein
VPGKLSIICFGDVHLGHNSTKSEWILPNLYAITKPAEVARTTDFIFIEGDLFDHLLYLNNKSLGPIQTWVIYLLNYCKRNDIALRVLEGTPGHDMRQSQLFEDLNSGFNIGCDLKYVTDLHYEYHEKTGVSILYLPDEHRPECSESLELAKRLLSEQGVDKVDFILMHGAFDYQLPEIVKNKHDNKMWQALVNHYIFVGHVHQFSQHGKILAAGSLDRLCHGDETPKGHIYLTISDSGDTINFIENTNAKIYSTIDCKGISVEKALAKIKHTVSKFPKESFIRVKAFKTDNIAVALDVLKVEYPDFNWKLEREDEFAKTNLDLAIEITLQQNYTPIDLTKENIPILLAEALRNKGVCEDKITRALQLLGKSL